MNKSNLYLPLIKKLFGKLNHLNWVLFYISHQLDRMEKTTQKIWKDKNIKIPRFMGCSLPITDLTGPTENRWLYYYPSGGYHIERDDGFSKSAKDAIRRFSCYTVSQAYENFETYLKDTVGIYLCGHPGLILKSHLSDFDKTNHGHIISNKEYWGQFVRYKKELFKGKDNAGYFKFLRKEISGIRDSEKNNIRGLDLVKWYKAVSAIRHAVVHAGLEIKNPHLSYLEEKDKHFFPIRSDGKKYYLNLNQENGKRNLMLFAEYGFLIFKSICIKEGYNWKIIKGLK